MMRIVDFHCDTASELYLQKLDLTQNPLSVDLARAREFSAYVQVAAYFCPPELSDEEGYTYITQLSRHFTQLTARCGIPLVTDRKALEDAVTRGIPAFVPAVEDSRILAGKPERADALFARGVRIATLTWRDEGVIGGSWNTHTGLTAFGKEAVMRFFELGILPDVSHASVPAFWDVVRLSKQAQKPFIASHSNAFALTPHCRNLTDAQIRAVGDAGGIIGVNFNPPFLSASDRADMGDICAHVRYLMNTGGERTIVLGTDFDGIESLPEGIGSIADFPTLYLYMKQNGFTPREIEALFFENGYRFLQENLPTKPQTQKGVLL